MLPNSVRVALALFGGHLCQSYVSTGLPIFAIQRLGWTNVQYAQVGAGAGLVGGIVGMLVGGLFIRRLGSPRLAQLCALAIGVLTAGLASAATYWEHPGLFIAFVWCFRLAQTFLFIGCLAAAMQCCWQRVLAMQFTLYMAVGNMGMSIGAALVGYLRSHYAWDVTFWVVPGLALLPIALLHGVRLSAHVRRVEALEDSYQEQVEPQAAALHLAG